MTYENGFVRKNYYSLELQHKICKEHIEKGVRLADLVRKYELSCHSLIHEWLRKLGYLPGSKKRARSAYIGLENYQDLKKSSKKSKPKTAEQQEIELLRRQLADSRIQAEGYRRMIEIAEAELKISIRKKPYTK